MQRLVPFALPSPGGRAGGQTPRLHIPKLVPAEPAIAGLAFLHDLLHLPDVSEIRRIGRTAFDDVLQEFPGLVAIGVLSAGLSSRSIQHGQECVVVAAGVCIACYFAHRMVPVQSTLWSILAVGLTALAAYLWAGVRPAGSGLPQNIPSSHFLRVLPLQFISVGTAAAIAMFWYMYAPEPPKPARRKAAREGGS